MNQICEDKKIRDDRWLASQIEFEQQPANTIVVLNPPLRWHSDLKAVRVELLKTFEHYKKLQERDRKPKSMPDFNAVDFGIAERSGWIASFGGVRSSSLTIDRALAIANALAVAAESRQCSLIFDPAKKYMLLQFENTELHLSIRERQSKISLNRSYSFSTLGQEIRPIPTNKLALVIDSAGASKRELVDKSSPIEKQLNSVFIHLYRTVLRNAEKAKVDKVREEKRQIEWRLYEELTQRRAADANAKENEKQLRRELIDEAGNWQHAQNIRAYASHVLSMPGAHASPHVLGWIDWATSVADEMDPSIARHEMLLKTM